MAAPRYWPVTLNGTVYEEEDFAGTNYVTGMPAAFNDFVDHAAALWVGTSTSSVAIGVGSKSFVTQPGKPWLPGAPLRISDAAAPEANWMEGVVTAYDANSGALTMSVTGYAGGGTKANWNINAGGGGYNLIGVLPVNQGGTGATDAAGARGSLGLHGTPTTAGDVGKMLVVTGPETMEVKGPVLPPMTNTGYDQGKVLVNEWTDKVALMGPIAGFTNRIINGDMRINQRLFGSGPITVSGQYLLDRFYAQFGGSYPVSFIHSANHPLYASGNSLYVGNTTAVTTNPGTYWAIRTNLEGYFVNDIMGYMSVGMPSTLSFYAFSTRGGKYYVCLVNSNAARRIVIPYTLPAGQWARVNLSIPPIGSIAGMNWTTGVGLGILWMLTCGSSSFTGTINAWHDTTSALSGSDQVQLWDFANQYFYLTDVQLYPGNYTPYHIERRPYSVELALCQRYLERQYGYFGAGWMYDTTIASVGMRFVTPKRTGVTFSSGPVANITLAVGGGGYPLTGLTATAFGLDSLWLRATIAQTMTLNAPIALHCPGGYDVSYVQVSAEL